MKHNFYTDNTFYYSYPIKTRARLELINDHWVSLRKFFFFLRKAEYYDQKRSLFDKFLSFYYQRRKNNLGNKLGLYIPLNVIGENFTLWHHGTVIINGDAKVGSNCIFHGNNCIGNNGKTTDAPVIHDGVELGFGSSVIGNVELAKGIKVGAGAVVTKSCLVEGATLVGVPARMVVKNDS